MCWELQLDEIILGITPGMFNVTSKVKVLEIYYDI